MPEHSIQVRIRQVDDLKAIIRLMERVYPQDRFGPSAIWKEENLLRHMERFPEGQMIAVDIEGALIATSTTLRTTRNLALAPHTWGEITDHGTLSTHDPRGEVLYGVNIAVDPAHQGQGVGRALYQARIALARNLGCTAFAAGARIPGYAGHQNAMEPESYLQAVVAGELFDPTLSKQLKLGFKMMGLLKGYARDYETCDHAAMILMELS
jgi:ribosomal protein S18 acetylase RimI-like enzyme